MIDEILLNVVRAFALVLAIIMFALLILIVVNPTVRADTSLFGVVFSGLSALAVFVILSTRSRR